MKTFFTCGQKLKFLGKAGKHKNPVKTFLLYSMIGPIYPPHVFF